MAYRNYLQYNYDDFGSSPANASNIDLPSISKSNSSQSHHYFNQSSANQSNVGTYYYADTLDYSQQQYFDNSDLQKYEIANITNQISQKFSHLYPQNVVELNQIFWKVFLWIAIVPLINSTCCNLYTLSTNIFHHAKLKTEYKKLTSEKSEVLGKMKEYHSVSGMKRTIKEEIKAIEENEILVKIL